MGTKRSHSSAFECTYNLPAIYCRNCAAYPNQYFACPRDFDQPFKRFTETSCPWNPLHVAVYLRELESQKRYFRYIPFDEVTYDPVFRYIPKRIVNAKLHFQDKTWNRSLIEPYVSIQPASKRYSSPAFSPPSAQLAQVRTISTSAIGSERTRLIDRGARNSSS